jgi:hypothetical protein
MTMEYEIADPKPSSLIESLRSVGYSLPTAIADIVDNSITAESKNIWLHFHWDGTNSHISITDDGHGMSEEELHEAMRPGSRSPLDERAPADLGRFGLGLKTASFSQCRKLTVISRRTGDPHVTRTWDLDYVIQHNEWRLLKNVEPEAKHTALIDKMQTGTMVVWTNLDRLTQGENTGDAAAHRRFNDSIDNVRQHLAMTFHRFLEDGSIKIHLNERPVAPWNPFLEGTTSTDPSPEELIPFGKSIIRFKGFVLPHKDMLSPEAFAAAAGPAGWNAHQGFYVYRNKRLLVPGDWLRLGRPNPWTKAEHYNLARIRIDIPNGTDNDWQLDVKKSTARPPALIRGRLTELADTIRTRARSVFVHRGRYGTRISPVDDFERPWESATRGDKRVYRISRTHPAVKLVLQTAKTHAAEIESMLRVLEETVPVQQIWLDVAEQTVDTSVPYDGIDFAVLRADMRRTYEFLLQSGINDPTAKANLRNIEPYNRYPQLIAEL